MIFIDPEYGAIFARMVNPKDEKVMEAVIAAVHETNSRSSASTSRTGSAESPPAASAAQPSKRDGSSSTL